MTFFPSLIARERILIYGEPAVGKTAAYLSIAKILKATHTDAHLYVIDNDRSVSRMMEPMGIEDYVTVSEVYDWPDYLSTLKKFLSLVRPDDWLICDLFSETWSAVQSYYSQQVFGDDIGNYFLTIRKQMAKDSSAKEFEGWTDWKYINKLYFDFSKPFAYKSPCHIIGVSSADAINDKLDDKQTLSVFSSVGYRPEGQKRLKHQFNTTIFLHKSPAARPNLPWRHLFTTVKDRERPLVVGKELHNFALDYLKGIAGWTIE